MVRQILVVLQVAVIPFCLLASTAARQENGGPLPPLEEIARVGNDGNPLPHYLTLLQYQSRFEASPQRDLFIQAKGTLLSFMGATKAAISTFDERESAVPSTGKPRLSDGYSLTDAVSEIGKIARKQRVIMIGEAHHVPETRLLTIQLLKPLWKEGFRYLAMEDIRAPETLTKSEGPTPKNGFYVNEPIMGELVRTATGLGYKIVMYDDQTELPNQESDPAKRVNYREELEAEHLKQRILDRDPRAKILVHVGYGHDSKEETTIGNEVVRLMAARFQDLTKIQPFCLDGYSMAEHSASQFEAPAFRQVADRVQRISLLSDGKGKYFHTFPGFDASVVLPRTQYESGRPNWLATVLRRHPTPIDPKALVGTGPWLVEARAAGQSDQAIPVDRILVEDPKSAPVLMLPTGRFRFRTFSVSNGWVATPRG